MRRDHVCVATRDEVDSEGRYFVERCGKGRRVKSPPSSTQRGHPLSPLSSHLQNLSGDSEPLRRSRQRDISYEIGRADVLDFATIHRMKRSRRQGFSTNGSCSRHTEIPFCPGRSRRLRTPGVNLNLEVPEASIFGYLGTHVKPVRKMLYSSSGARWSVIMVHCCEYRSVSRSLSLAESCTICHF